MIFISRVKRFFIARTNDPQFINIAGIWDHDDRSSPKMNVDQIMSSSIATDEYFDSLTDDRREVLRKVRRAIMRIWPAVDENIIQGIPTYQLNGHPFLSMASRKNYIALYIVPHDLLNAFKTELRQYDHGRSCIRFKRLDIRLFDLLERIIMYTGSQLHTSKYFKKELAMAAIGDDRDK